MEGEVLKVKNLEERLNIRVRLFYFLAIGVFLFLIPTFFISENVTYAVGVCSTPGATRTMYSSASVACGTACLSETQTCVCVGYDCAWTGTFTQTSCSPSTRVRYSKISASCGYYCSSQTQYCQSNGSWSGTYTDTSCTPYSQTRYCAQTSSCGTAGYYSETQYCQSNGSFSPSSCSLTSPPSITTRTRYCAQTSACGTYGYSSETQYCQLDGSWSGSCSLTSPPSVTTRVRYNVASTCGGVCDSETQYCQSSGSWSPNNYSYSSCTVLTPTTWYRDADGDGYGNSSQTTSACSQPAGYVSNSSDCNDSNSSVWRYLTGYQDSDNDGWTVGTAQSVCSGTSLPSGWRSSMSSYNDCNDSDSTIYPGATKSQSCTISGACNTCSGTQSVTWNNACSVSYGSCGGCTPIPCSVSGLLATTVSQSQINLSWNAAGDATHYEIYNQSYTLLGVSGSTSYSLGGLSCGTSYVFMVRACNGGGCSSYASASAQTSACDTTPPSISFSPTSNTTWQQSQNVTVNASDTSGVSWLKYCWTTGSNCTPDTTATNGATLTQSSEGSWMICAQASDNYNNVSSITCTSRFNVDRTPPYCSTNCPFIDISLSQIDSNTLQVSMSGNYVDNLAGLSSTPYGFSLDNSSYSWQSSKTKTYTGLTCGQPLTAYTKVRDVVGNESGLNSSSWASGLYCAPTFSYAALDLPTEVCFTWNQPAGGSSFTPNYKLYRNSTLIYDGSVTTFCDAGLNYSTTYNYSLKAYHSSVGDSSFTNISFTTLNPFNSLNALADMSGPNNVKLTWSNPNTQCSVDNLFIYKNGVEIYNAGGSSAITSYIDYNSSSTEGIFNYYVSYLFSDCSSEHVGLEFLPQYSNTATFITAPLNPTNLTATPISSTTINLSWTDNSSIEDEFRVYRNGTFITSLPANTTSYSMGGLSCGTTYNFMVTAFKAGGGEGGLFNTTSAQTFSCPPSAPTGLSATAISSSQINLSWNAVSGATSYKIYRNNSYLTTVGGTSYSDTGLNCGTQYSYYVVAVNQGGDSSPSASASASTNSCNNPPSTPTLSSPAGGACVANGTSFCASVSDPDGDNVRARFSINNSWYYGNYVSGSGTSCYTYTGGNLSGATWYAYAEDINGAISGNSASRSISVDGTSPSPNPPTVSVVSTGLTTIDVSLPSASDSGCAGLSSTAYGFSINGSAYSWESSPAKTFSGLSCGTSYTISAKIRDAVGNETSVGSVNANTNVCVSPPTGLLASPVSPSQIDLSWNAAQGAASYKVYRNGVYLTTVSATSYSDTGLNCGTLYSYYVVSVNSSGDSSSNSQTVSASTYACISAPPSVSSLNAVEDSRGSVNVGWGSTTADGYKIYLKGGRDNAVYPVADTSNTSAVSSIQGGCPGVFTVYVIAYNNDPYSSSVDSSCQNVYQMLGISAPTGKKCSVAATTTVVLKSCTGGFFIE